MTNETTTTTGEARNEQHRAAQMQRTGAEVDAEHAEHLSYGEPDSGCALCVDDVPGQVETTRETCTQSLGLGMSCGTPTTARVGRDALCLDHGGSTHVAATQAS